MDHLGAEHEGAKKILKKSEWVFITSRQRMSPMPPPDRDWETFAGEM